MDPLLKPGQRINCIALVGILLGCLNMTAHAHESHQPTGLIPPNSVWKYDDDGVGDADWKTLGFDDSAWGSSKVPLGYGESHLHKPHLQSGQVDYYLRHVFEVKDRTAITGLTLRARYDDAFVLYLNGSEIMSSHSLEGPVAAREAKQFETFDLPSTGLCNGSNVLAVRLVNHSSQSSDIVWDANLLAGSGATSAAGAPAGAEGLLRGPYLQNACEDAITICWRTRAPLRGRVDYWQPGRKERFYIEEPLPTTEHSVRLTRLKPGNHYKYSIDGMEAVYDLRTLPPAHTAAPTRVWIIGDSGTGNQNARAVYDAYSKFTGDRPTDVWLMLGDNAYGYGTDQEFQNAVFNLYTPLLHTTCLWPAVGNHETYWCHKDDNPLTHNQADPYLAIFEMPARGEAGGVPSGTELYYSFDYGRTHFICLDSQVSSRKKEGAQYRWLKADLEQIRDDQTDWIIAYWHHAPYTHGTHNSDKEREHIEMREVFLPLLEAHGVDLTFGGHSHTYERSILMHGHYGKSDTYDPQQHALDAGDGRPAGDGSYRQSQHSASGTIHTVAGTSGMAQKFRAPHLPFMVENLSKLASVVVDIDGRRLDVTTLGSDGQTLDSYTLLKD